jgi:hypothetical protein
MPKWLEGSAPLCEPLKCAAACAGRSCPEPGSGADAQ